MINRGGEAISWHNNGAFAKFYIKSKSIINVIISIIKEKLKLLQLRNFFPSTLYTLTSEEDYNFIINLPVTQVFFIPHLS